MIEPGGWVSVGPVAGSEPSHQASQQYAGQRGRVILPPLLPDGDYTVKMDGGGPEVRLPAVKANLAHSLSFATIRFEHS